MSKVKVRVAVVVDHLGDWNTCGSKNMSDKDAMSIASETVEEGEARYFIEAELDIPEQNTVQAAVEKV